MSWLKSALVLALLASALLAQAQDNAQICVRLYEDRGTVGALDAGDPFITRDVGVNLADERGVIIRTALIDDAPQGSSGRVCFTQLAAGQYTVSVVSAAFTPTTDSVFVTSVGGSAVPLVFDVGMRRLQEALPELATTPGMLTPAQARFALERIFVAGLAASVVVAVMVAVGAVIYVLFLRPRPQPAAVRNPYMPPRSVMTTDTGRMPPITPAPLRPVAAPPPAPLAPASDEDTGPTRTL